MHMLKEWFKLLFYRKPKTEKLSLEQQLSNPKGVEGIKLGHTMYASNLGMITSSIDLLNLNDHDVVLELGHGNCHHLNYIEEKVQQIDFHGLEISDVMHKEAKQFQSELKTTFKLYDGTIIPYKDLYFDKLMTVNTIYFWEDPSKLLQEIDRVLKVKGVFVLTFVAKDFMKKLPFVGDRFALYDISNIERLIERTNLQITKIEEKVERVKNKLNVLVDREYLLIEMIKN